MKHFIVMQVCNYLSIGLNNDRVLKMKVIFMISTLEQNQTKE